MKQQLIVTRGQLAKFMSLRDDEGHSLENNYRITQPLGSRKVYCYHSGIFECF